MQNDRQGNGNGAADPSRIFEIGFGFFASKVLLTAVTLELFTILSDRAMTGAELGRAMGLHPRGVADFLDALVALGFLEREGDGEHGLYRNTELAARFLDKASPDYIGGILEMCDARLFGFWNDLGEALRTGRPQNEIKHGGRSVFEELYADPRRLEQFVEAMASVSRGNFRALAGTFDFSAHDTLCDLGGASGLLAVTVARHHPHMRCITFDLPVVEPIARRTIERAGLDGRVTVHSGDFFTDPLPPADIYTASLILHDWNLAKKKALIGRVHAALPEGGAFIAIENLIDDGRRHNAFGLLMSLNMLVETGDGFDFSGADFRSWCLEAGFRHCEVRPLTGPSSAAIAYK